MRFSAVVVAAIATNAAAWQPQRQAYGWSWNGFGNWGKGQTSVSGSIQPTPVPVATTPAAVIPTAVPTTSAPVVEEAAPATTSSAPAAAATTAASSSGSLTSDQQAALDAHNKARAEVGTPNLVWDETLAANAQEWATHLTSVGSLTHSQVSDQGENLYMQSGGDSPNLNAVNAFVSEKSEYNGETISSTNYMSFGHYTQVVWKSTTKVGMATATDSSGATYVVARYSPPGNYIGEKPY
ncbi:Pathogenesis-related protein PR-1 type [Colletotrichum gloeosporioides]|uniref:Pathogenesis-related protein PR-1 type n=1 Tax=Colletotrichum gloeosporioides TaxID=474922 RepID=A0A8H4CLK6_COLGL|nr:Pathogenesis-related protein PR-1 type [Colletotrichum gloeosporioides]KAF3806039.1 Pathogenesis-related protein PR-1 type [Colletotrichum gloeosporioides]